jgi:hypothetical protein
MAYDVQINCPLTGATVPTVFFARGTYSVEAERGTVAVQLTLTGPNQTIGPVNANLDSGTTWSYTFDEVREDYPYELLAELIVGGVEETSVTSTNIRVDRHGTDCASRA